LQRREKNTFWACVGGWVLDAMDVQMFSFAIPAIIAVFAITNADAGLIGTATLLTSAFGGWFAGALSDRFGRVRTLQITIAWFAVFTFLCGYFSAGDCLACPILGRSHASLADLFPASVCRRTTYLHPDAGKFGSVRRAGQLSGNLFTLDS
jgi:MFS family permease